VTTGRGAAAATGGGAMTGRPSAGGWTTGDAVAAGVAATGGLATTGPAGGLAAMAGVCGAEAATTGDAGRAAAEGGAATTAGAGRGCGTILRGAGLGSAAAGGGGAAGRGAGGAGAGTAAGRGTTAGWTGRGGATWAAASCCFRSRIALATSPTWWTCDQSIFDFGSASWRAPVEPPRPLRICARTRSASSASMELEWVFFSVTPTAVRASRISRLLTSSSRANSLIRTVLIRPRIESATHLSLVPHTDCS
jgi:hypothetical protein